MAEASDEKPVPVARRPASLQKARERLRDAVLEAGIQVSGGLGSDAAIPFDEAFVNITLLSNDELKDLFSQKKNEFSTSAERDRLQAAFTAVGRSRSEVPSRGLELNELFHTRGGGRALKNVLAFGSAGSGKTTVFLEMLVYLWCMGRLWPDKFDLVLAVELREAEVQAASCLSELLAPKLKSLNLQKDEQLELERYFSDNPNRLCVVLDGLDECKFDSCNKFMRDLLRRKGSNDVHVIVTSRPCPDAYKLSQCGKYQQQIEVLGFSPENVHEYVRKVVGGGRAEAMLKKLHEKPDVFALMSTPIFAALACELFLSGKGVAKCSTELYSAVLLRVVERAGGAACKSFADAKPRHVQTLCELGRFAFRMLALKKLVFAESDLDSSDLSEEARHLGLLLACKGGSSTVVRQYRFSHLSLQEFLAAWYMERCLVKEERHGVGLVERVGVYSGHMSMFWRFLIALLPRTLAFTVMEQNALGMFRSGNDAPASVTTALDGAMVEVVRFLNLAPSSATTTDGVSDDIRSDTDAPSSDDLCASLADEMRTNSSVLSTELEMEKIRDGLCSVVTLEQMKLLADVLLEKTPGKGKGRQRVQNAIPSGRELTNELYLETLLSLWKSKVAVPTGTAIHEALQLINRDSAAACESFLHPGGMLTSTASTGCPATATSVVVTNEKRMKHRRGILQLLVAYHEHAQYQGASCDGNCPLFRDLFATGFVLSSAEQANDPAVYMLVSVQECLAIAFLLSHHRCVNHEEVDLSCMVMRDVGFSSVSVALQQCRNVRFLWLRGVAVLNADLLLPVISALSGSLEEVDVSGHHVGVAGFLSVCRALCACKRVRSVGVHGMLPGGVAPLNAVSEMLEECTALQVLGAAGNTYTCDGVAERRFVNAVRGHAELRVLGVSECGLREHVVSSLRLLQADPKCKLAELYL